MNIESNWYVNKYLTHIQYQRDIALEIDQMISCTSCWHHHYAKEVIESREVQLLEEDRAEGCDGIPQVSTF